jgi:AAA+ ATPase superfamily predicted ATPase
MRLSFLNRQEEMTRLRAQFARDESTLTVVYGRRRCGKSRLILEALPPETSVYYVGDDRENVLQRVGLANEISRLIPGFADVHYPEWDTLLSHWFERARPGSILAIDEFPALVTAAREIPSLLQKHFDRNRAGRKHIVLTGSSQRMMQGLVLDRRTPLFGRAAEIMKLDSLPAGWIQQALDIEDGNAAIEVFSVWGGIPRYWELAAEHPVLSEAIESLILNPLGILYEEPTALLFDDMREIVQTASLLTLIGRGCHRPSELASRLEKPVTDLSRPLARLLDLELIRRDRPFGSSAGSTKRTFYQIQDPFLRFWFRFVEPERSRLEAGQHQAVLKKVLLDLPYHTSGVWEELVRASIAKAGYFGKQWKPASRWWGAGRDRRPLEIDVVAESGDGKALLLGEVKWSESVAGENTLQHLHKKSEQFPLTGDRELYLGVWQKGPARKLGQGGMFSPEQVLAALI